MEGGDSLPEPPTQGMEEPQNVQPAASEAVSSSTTTESDKHDALSTRETSSPVKEQTPQSEDHVPQVKKDLPMSTQDVPPQNPEIKRVLPPTLETQPISPPTPETLPVLPPTPEFQPVPTQAQEMQPVPTQSQEKHPTPPQTQDIQPTSPQTQEKQPSPPQTQEIQPTLPQTQPTPSQIHPKSPGKVENKISHQNAQENPDKSANDVPQSLPVREDAQNSQSSTIQPVDESQAVAPPQSDNVPSPKDSNVENVTSSDTHPSPETSETKSEETGCPPPDPILPQPPAESDSVSSDIKQDHDGIGKEGAQKKEDSEILKEEPVDSNLESVETKESNENVPRSEIDIAQTESDLKEWRLEKDETVDESVVNSESKLKIPSEVSVGSETKESSQAEPMITEPPADPSLSPEAKSSQNRSEGRLDESSMDMETGLVEKQVPVFLCDENSKDKPPQNFKPFSHYNTEGKLISDDAGPFKMNSPITMEDGSFPGSDVASNSMPTSSDPASRVNTPSKFQGQFMDFLKCTDDATVHSIPNADNQATPAKVTDSEISLLEETSQTPSEKGKSRSRKRKKAPNQPDENSATGDGKRQLTKMKPKEGGDESKPADDASKPGDPTAKPGDPTAKPAENAFPPAKLFEYQWPQEEKNSEWFFLQEQVSAYLQVKSFKRRYPELVRRPVGMDERNFLAENGIVSEMQCDLGLMALKSDQVYNLMSKDFPTEYQAYAEVLHARERERNSEKNKAQADLAKMDKSHINDLVKKAVKSAADFNAQFMREKREERKAYFDLQTYEIHYPQGSIKKLPAEATKPSSYPLALIPGQYQDYCKKYSAQQLKYFPINTAMYDSPKHLKTIYADPSDKYESELDSQSASSGDAQDASSSSGSSSGSSSDSESENSVVEEVVPEPPPPLPKKNAKTPKSKKTAVPKVDPNATCSNCQGNSKANKIGEPEELVKCSECGRHGHPSCLELTEEMIPNIKTYPWQCMECKTCVECMDPYDEDKMMFCDHCDRGYHTFCVGLRSIPTGRWECPSCRPDPPNKRRRR